MNPTDRYEYLADMARIDRLSAPDISDRSYLVTAEFEPTEPREGVMLAWGSMFAGFVIYIKNAQLCYEYVYSESLTAHAVRSLSAAGRKAHDPAEIRAHGRQAGRAILIVDGVAAAR